MTKRKPVTYLPPGIYGERMLSLLFPGHRIIVTKDGRPPAPKRRKPTKAPS